MEAKQAYLDTGKKWGEDWIMIDAKDLLEGVQTKIYSVVTKLLGQPPLFR